MQHSFTLSIAPYPAPRQVRSDAWNPRPCVVQYRLWRDTVDALLVGYTLPDRPYFVFDMPMPPSWSGRKRQRMQGTPHCQKPDLDNMIKAVLDTVYRGADDSHVWCLGALKRWAAEGAIHVYAQDEVVFEVDKAA